MIAKAAVKQAGEEGTDVVLIDTAGRMQVRRCPGSRLLRQALRVCAPPETTTLTPTPRPRAPHVAITTEQRAAYARACQAGGREPAGLGAVRG